MKFAFSYDIIYNGYTYSINGEAHTGNALAIAQGSMFTFTAALAGYEYIGLYNADGIRVDSNNRFVATEDVTLYARFVAKSTIVNIEK